MMEYRSILVATVTIYCGLYYLTKDLSEETKIMLFVIMLAVNAYFLTYWIYKMFGAGMSIAKQKMPCLKRFLRHRELRDQMPDERNVEPMYHEKMYLRGKETVISIMGDANAHMDEHLEHVELYGNMHDFFLAVVDENLDGNVFDSSPPRCSPED